MAGFAHGAALLGRGFAMWRRRPGLMLLGVLPALLVFLLLAGALVALVLTVGDLAAWATPFADDWAAGLRDLLRIFLALAVLVGAVMVSAALFVGLTLAVGDPFYERIWAETERMLGGEVPDHGPGLGRAILDGLRLALVGVAAAVVLVVVGFVPVIGTVVGAVLGLLVSGRFLAGELVARPLEARGYDRRGRAALLRGHGSTLYGFGIAAQAFFLVPLVAVVMMPAAVVGATYLAREVLDAAAQGPVTAVPARKARR